MRIVIFIFLLLFLGCDKILKKAPKEENIYEKKLKEINFSTITSYPAFEACDTIIDKENRGKCFFRTINDTLENRFINSKISAKKDSILLNIYISNKGKLTLKEADSLKTINDSIINNITKSFPKLEPAQKNGIFVNSSFQMKIKVRK